MTYAVNHWLPGELKDGARQPPSPCPDLLTPAEAARYLRIDELPTDNPERSMRSLREREGIRAVKIGTNNFFPRTELTTRK